MDFRVCRLVLGLPLTATLCSAAAAQSPEPITAAQVRTLTRQAEAQSKGDGSALVLALDRRVRAAWGDFESFPLSVAKREDLTITLTTPYMRYRQTLADYLRIRRPIAAIEWIDAAIVHVSPERLDAPDIKTITVARNGTPVPPTRNALAPMNFMDGNGKAATLHAGDVQFGVEAFAPGAIVAVSAIPQAGTPFVLTLDDDQLRMLK